MSSLSEIKAKKLIKIEHPRSLIRYTANFLTKIYPAFYRQDSSNFKPLAYWIYGFQIGKRREPNQKKFIFSSFFNLTAKKATKIVNFQPFFNVNYVKRVNFVCVFKKSLILVTFFKP